MRIEVSLQRAKINDRKDIMEKESHIDYLGVFFKVDNGKEYFDSIVVKNLDEPRWTDSFQLTIMNLSEIIFFQLVLNDRHSDTSRILDSFDIRGNEIANELEVSKIFKDTVITNSGNEYEIVVKKKGDDISKLKIIEKKIEQKSAMYKTLNQLHSIAKESMENLISKKGMDLIKEWGFMSKKAKTIQESKAKTIDTREEEKKSTTPKHIKNKSFNLSNQKPKTPTTGFIGLRADPAKFK